MKVSISKQIYIHIYTCERGMLKTLRKVFRKNLRKKSFEKSLCGQPPEPAQLQCWRVAAPAHLAMQVCDMRHE